MKRKATKPPEPQPKVSVELTTVRDNRAASELFTQILRSVRSANERHRKETKTDDAA